MISVYDGDTLRADVDLGFGICARNQVIRLLGINTPELRGEQQALGIQVRDWLRNQVLGKEIIVRTRKDKKGKYGRWLGEIWVDGLSVNEQLKEQGYEAYY